MKIAGIAGVRRGRTAITTRSAHVPDSLSDLVNRQFTASKLNELWVADITYVRPLSGFVYTAFVTDVFSRKIVGWARRSSMRTEARALEALEQAIQGAKVQGVKVQGVKETLVNLTYHCDRGSQYTSIAYNEKLADYAIKPSTGRG